MQYFFFKMQRVRVLIILTIVLLIVAAYWLMTSSPKPVGPNTYDMKKMKDRIHKAKINKFQDQQGHFAGRLGRNSFPKYDSKSGKDSGKIGGVQIGRPVDRKIGDNKGKGVKSFRPKTEPVVNLKRNWGGSDKKKSDMSDVRDKFPSRGNKTTPSDKIKDKSSAQLQRPNVIEKPSVMQKTRNKMLDSQFAMDRQQVKDALQRDREKVQHLTGNVESLAKKYRVPYTVHHGNKKYQLEMNNRIPSSVPEQMGPPSAYILTTDKLPKDKFLPSVGNGHIATRVDSDTVMMNGLYSGVGNASHRARIPSMVAFNIYDFHPTGLPHKRKYSLNMLEGVYTEIISGEDFVIEKRTYAHRTMTNLLISEIEVCRSYQPGQTILKLMMKNNRGAASKDITILEGKCKTDIAECLYIHGKVNAWEMPQSQKPEFHAYFDSVPPRLDIPVVPQGQKGICLKWVYMASIGKTEQECEENYKAGAKLLERDALLSLHRSAWKNLWLEGAVTIDGNVALAKAVFSAMYNTLSSLPAFEDDSKPFFGLSPTDLAHGNMEEDYSGHIKSDQEIWMFPNILLFHADIAKLLIKSRERIRKPAQQNARDNGFLGAQFPAEVAYSGIEVGPPESKYEIHTGGDIAHAIMQYIYMTNDVNFYVDMAKTLLIDITNFYRNRVQFNTTKHQYTFKNVISLDAKRGKVSNSIYTNTIAKIALSAPYIMSSHLGLKSSHLKNWLAVANKTYIPYDDKMRYHPEDDGYRKGARVNQPEALMLRYPLMQDIPLTKLRKDLAAYEREIDGPATAWVTLAMAFMQLKDYESAWSKLKGTMMNIQHPFQVWTETSTGGGAKNYLTLMGAFLQGITFGFGGFRIKPDRLEFDPTMPPSVKTMNITSVDYMGASFDFRITEDNIYISMSQMKNTAPPFKIVIYGNGQMHFIKMNKPILMRRQKAAIFPLGMPKFAKPANDVKIERMPLPLNKGASVQDRFGGQKAPRDKVGQADDLALQPKGKFGMQQPQGRRVLPQNLQRAQDMFQAQPQGKILDRVRQQQRSQDDQVQRAQDMFQAQGKNLDRVRQQQGAQDDQVKRAQDMFPAQGKNLDRVRQQQGAQDDQVPQQRQDNLQRPLPQVNEPGRHRLPPKLGDMKQQSSPVIKKKYMSKQGPAGVDLGSARNQVDPGDQALPRIQKNIVKRVNSRYDEKLRNKNILRPADRNLPIDRDVPKRVLSRPDADLHVPRNRGVQVSDNLPKIAKRKLPSAGSQSDQDQKNVIDVRRAGRKRKSGIPRDGVGPKISDTDMDQPKSVLQYNKVKKIKSRNDDAIQYAGDPKIKVKKILRRGGL